MSRPVVVAVDGSEESLRAAEWAACEARLRNSPLRIVAAPGLPPRVRVQAASAAMVTNALRGIAARGLAAAVERVTEMAPSLWVDTDLLDGPPAQAVAGSASGADLLVVGARGSGGFTALTLGSVSRHAASHAPCPAVVVREAVAPDQEIVVGVRDPDDAGAALGFAFEEAAMRGVPLLAVHAVAVPSTGPGTSSAARRVAADVAADAAVRLAYAVREWLHKYPDVEVRSDVVRAHPAHVLASLSARASLVVIGRHDGLAGEAGGSSIQHAVLEHARGPVAVVPSDAPAGSPGLLGGLA